MRAHRCSPLLLVTLLLGCGASTKAQVNGHIGSHQASDETVRLAAASAATAPEPVKKPSEPTRASEPPLEPDAVLHAQRLYVGYRLRDRRWLERDDFISELATAQTICLGEQHDSVVDHFAELELLKRLAERQPMSGRRLALGLESIETPGQAALGRYLAGTSNESSFRQQVGFAERWGFDFALTRPLLDVARQRNLDVVALGAPGELVKRVAAVGLDGLAADERQALPELDLDNSEHYAAFNAAMTGHPASDADPENVYEAQVVRDEVMAEVTAGYLRAAHPARQLLVAAGRQHCRRDAIPQRISRRVPTRALAVTTWLGNADQAPEVDATAYDYVMVLEPSSQSR